MLNYVATINFALNVAMPFSSPQKLSLETKYRAIRRETNVSAPAFANVAHPGAHFAVSLCARIQWTGISSICVGIFKDNRNSSSGTKPKNVGDDADALSDDSVSGNGAGGSANRRGSR